MVKEIHAIEGKDLRLSTSFEAECRNLFFKVILGISLIIFTTAGAFAFIDYRLHQRTAKNFVALMRDSILLGDFRKVMQESSNLVRNESTFSKILFKDLKGIEIFDLGESSPLSLRFGFDLPIYFDEIAELRAGTFHFLYSVRDIITVFVWLLLSGVGLGIWFYSMVKSRLAIQYERDMELYKKTTLVSMSRHLAHDLRAPLGQFERLIHLDPATPIGKHVDSIRGSLSRLHSMIESLRYADSEMIVRPRLCLLDFSIGIQSMETASSTRNIKIVLEDFTPRLVYLDLLKFERVWLNLLTNAIEAATTKVSIQIIEDGSDLILRKIDDGKGVAAQMIPNLFKSGATYGKQNGTGLGLAYVKQVVQGHGGAVNYQRQGELSIFECHFPNALNIVPSGQELEPFASIKEPIASKQIKISIAMQPADFGKSVRIALNKRGDQRYEFLLDVHSGVDLIVTNSQDISNRWLDLDLNVVEVSSTLSEDEVIRRLVSKFGIK